MSPLAFIALREANYMHVCTSSTDLGSLLSLELARKQKETKDTILIVKKQNVLRM